MTLIYSLFRRLERRALWILLGLAALKLVLHLLTTCNYGYFRDTLLHRSQ